MQYIHPKMVSFVVLYHKTDTVNQQKAKWVKTEWHWFQLWFLEAVPLHQIIQQLNFENQPTYSELLSYCGCCNAQDNLGFVET